MGTLRLPDGELNYQVQGNGLPLLMLHAGVADSRMWEPQVAVFADTFQLIRPDLRGFGQSALPDGSFAHHEDLLALLNALGAERTWLMGASFGGRIAVDFCLSYPERVRGLVLLAPALGGMPDSEEMNTFGEQEEALLEAGKLDEAAALNVTMWVDGPFRDERAVAPEIRALVAAMQKQAFLQPTPPNVALRWAEPPAIERLEELRVPVLVISGGLDVPAFSQFAEMMVQRLPSVRHVIFPDAAHLPSLENPPRFNPIVMEFIVAQEAAASGV